LQREGRRKRRQEYESTLCRPTLAATDPIPSAKSTAVESSCYHPRYRSSRFRWLPAPRSRSDRALPAPRSKCRIFSSTQPTPADSTRSPSPNSPGAHEELRSPSTSAVRPDLFEQEARRETRRKSWLRRRWKERRKGRRRRRSGTCSVVVDDRRCRGGVELGGFAHTRGERDGASEQGRRLVLRQLVRGPSSPLVAVSGDE
jgi:hypothetical protein